MATILIVDDEEDMRHLIEMYLNNSGFATFEAENGEQMADVLAKEEIDLVLLDIMLPGEDGFELCAKIREKSSIPIIFLSAKGEEWDKVKGFGLGGDDYIVKPFAPGELVARIGAVLRRVPVSRATEDIRLGPVILNVEQRTVTVDGEQIHVTYKEFELLALMMKRPGKVFTREELLDRVWGMDYQGGLRTVDTHIKTLRMKLGKKAEGCVRTVWGSGYKFEEEG